MYILEKIDGFNGFRRSKSKEKVASIIVFAVLVFIGNAKYIDREN